MTHDLPPEILACGDIVDGMYEVIGRIGWGGMAQVYKVSDLQTCTDLALKICASPGESARFQREVRAMTEIESQHVMPIYSSGEHNGLPFLIMPLAQQSLDDVQYNCQEGGEIEDVLRAFLEMCEGVDALHGKGFCHRDIKPSNILQVDDHWVISDMGLSKNVVVGDPTLTRTGVLLGTDRYMAPEQRTGNNKSVGQSTDIYQLGLVLYQMLTGIPPDGAFFISDLPSGEAEIVKKCLQRKPSDRYSRVADLMDDVRGLLTRYERAVHGQEVEDDGSPDSVKWIDSSHFSTTCRRSYRESYSRVRNSERWTLVISAVQLYWEELLQRFDAAFVDGIIPDGCKAGAGPSGLLKGLGSETLDGFEAVERDVVRWLAFRRLVLAAVQKYTPIAMFDIDALLVLFLNYVAPEDRTQEFLNLRGWRQHVVRFRPWLTKIGLRPSDLALGVQNVPSLGVLERRWLDTLELGEPYLEWWDLDELV